ncbi:MAG: hypothetical protein JWQ88_692 [Rhodoferax sp.]|nr:hypothetical protein [Rhodoferax sp.]
MTPASAMTQPFAMHWMANAVLLVHVGIVLFVVLGLPLTVAGNLRGWRWVNTAWFRVAHLATIAIVVAEAALGWVCPLTTLEMWLRSGAGGSAYAGDFVGHWLSVLLYWNAPPWAFTVAYSVFGLAVVAAWWCFPPDFARRASGKAKSST